MPRIERPVGRGRILHHGSIGRIAVTHGLRGGGNGALVGVGRDEHDIVDARAPHGIHHEVATRTRNLVLHRLPLRVNRIVLAAPTSERIARALELIFGQRTLDIVGVRDRIHRARGVSCTR